jgi:hypothetical protein
MNELTCIFHVYSQHTGLHPDYRKTINDGLKNGLDVIVFANRNVFINHFEGYHQKNGSKLLVICGEEINLQPHSSEQYQLFIFNPTEELSQFYSKGQALFIKNRLENKLTFLNLNTDQENSIHTDRIPEILGEITGFELWNAAVSVNRHLNNKLDEFLFSFIPFRYIKGPAEKDLEIWDESLMKKKKVVAVAGSDAFTPRLNRFKRLPQSFICTGLNTHVFTPQPLSGNLNTDRAALVQAIQIGHCFIGYDGLQSTKGFRFSAQTKNRKVIMGDQIKMADGVTFQIHLPVKATCRLIRNGSLIQKWTERELCTYITNSPGIYRVECELSTYRQNYGWIYSNPIIIE